MTNQPYYHFEIKDIYGDEYIVPARDFREAKEKLQMVHDIFEAEIESYKIIAIVR